MKQTERIQYYEAILDEAETVIKELSEALENYSSIQNKIKELEIYYLGPIWMQDYKDDEEGKIARDLKRGVLSEDAVYNLLSEQTAIKDRLEEILKQ